MCTVYMCMCSSAALTSNVLLCSEELERKIERQKKKISDHKDTVQRLNTKINSLTAEKLKIQEGVQQKCKLEDQRRDREQENTKLNQEIEVRLVFNND